MPAQQHNRFPNTQPSNLSHNPYLIKYDGRSAVFCTPLWRTLLWLLPAVCYLGIYFFLSLNLAETGYRNWVVEQHDISGFENQLVFLAIVSIPFLWVGGICITASGRSSISFDLKGRTYRRVALAPPPIFGKRQPDTTGWGNPLRRRILAGPMSELEGVQIVEREDESTRIYSVYIISTDKAIPPCVVYYTTNLQEAEAQLQQIASLIGLPALETLMMDGTSIANGIGTAQLPGNASLNRRWANLYYGVYWAQRDETRISFALPAVRRREVFVFTGFWLFMALMCVSLGIYCAVTHDPTTNFASWCRPAVGCFAIAAAAFTFTGVNRITFDLRDRTYERVLYRSLAVGNITDYAGMGNRFRRMDQSGTMQEIAGIDLHERPGKHLMTYTVLLRWADSRQPPMGIGFFADRREARQQAAEVAEALTLPVLETDSRS